MTLAATDHAVVAIEGELCLADVPDLRFRLDQALGTGAAEVVVDLAGCTLLTAAALRVLAVTAERLEAAGGRLRLRSPQPLAARVLAVTGLDRLL